MLKKPLTNEQMKELVGHYLTNDYGNFKYLVTGYCEGINGEVSILVADRNGETRYSAYDLVDTTFRIDSPYGKVVWNDSTEDILRVVDRFVIDVLDVSLMYAKDIGYVDLILRPRLEHMYEEAKHKLKRILSEESVTK